MLKLISFGIDYHWSITDKATIQIEKHKETCYECTKSNNCLKLRQDAHAVDYSLTSFIGYCFYLPLYLAGPILSYNAWISQVKSP